MSITGRTTSPQLTNNSLEDEYFKGIQYVPSDRPELLAAIQSVAEEENLVVTPEWTEKLLQLSRFNDIHHGVMLVGEAASGKSTVYQVLLKALQKVDGVESTTYLIDAKAIAKQSLYGKLDVTTREWTDGLLTATLRKIAENLRGEDKKRHWIIFDGDVDPDWVENLNSTLDDNKLLTLPNGERIALPPNVRIIFEVANLDFATPATVTRCGMIWFSDDVVTPRMLLHRGLHNIGSSTPDEDVDIDIVEADSLLPQGIHSPESFIRNILANDLNLEEVILQARKLNHVMEYSVIRSVDSLISLLKADLRRIRVHVSQNAQVPLSENLLQDVLKKNVMLDLVWAFAGDSTWDDRNTFAEYLGSLPVFVSATIANILDYYVDIASGNWVPWAQDVAHVEIDAHAVASSETVVPTVDTKRHESLIYGLLNDHKPVVLCGPPGSGKTMTLFSSLRRSPALDVVGLNFSKTTSPSLLIKSLEQHCEYRKTLHGTILSPSIIGRWLVVFCDEINLPAKDTYGTQRVITLLRQMIEQNGFWRESTREWVTLSRVQFVGACNPPSDVGRNALPMRFLRHTAVVYVDYPAEQSLRQIYLTFNNAVLKVMPSLRGYAEALTQAMLTLFLETKRKFSTQVRSHYIYSPRELTRWVRGIYEAIKSLESLPVEGLIRIWAHEALRLFHDRLVDDSERQWTVQLVDRVAKDTFLNVDLQSALRQPILYSNWLTKDYLPVERDSLRSFVQARLRVFCEEELEVPLVLFDDLLEHVLRIDRVLRQPQGHLIMIGISSWGKVSGEFYSKDRTDLTTDNLSALCGVDEWNQSSPAQDEPQLHR